LRRSLIALGANIAGPHGAPAQAVESALRALDSFETRLVARSRFYRSPAWPNPDDPEFINVVAAVDTSLSPSDLLANLHGLEVKFGRERRAANAPRTLDLDILDYGGQISAPGETPILPHPRMQGRAFVLLPLAEIVPDWRHPVTGATIADLIAALPASPSAWPVA